MRRYAGGWCLTCPHAYEVILADFDGNGDGDLGAGSAGYANHTLAWYQNRGPEGWDRA
jgi:hypothetical protein